MDKPTTNIRITGLGVLFGLVFLIFVVRLWSLQVVNWESYAEKAQRNRTTIVYGPAPRGLIFDAAGKILVDNKYTWAVEIMPNKLPRSDEELDNEIAILAGILPGSSAITLRKEFENVRSKRMQTVFLKDYDDVDFDVVAHIEERKLELPGVQIGEIAKRHYPNGTLAAHVLGYARSIGEEQYETYQYLRYPDGLFSDNTTFNPPDGISSMPIYGMDAIVGQTGAEQLCELDTGTAPPVPILQGRRSRTVYEVDRLMNPVRTVYEEKASPGATVFLTLDARVQKAAEDALAHAVQSTTGRTGAAVCLDLKTGGIVAMASYPTFDPNGWIRRWTPEEYAVFREDGVSEQDKLTPLVNKAIAGLYPPGSTFKLVSATAALETTPVKLTTTCVCTGRIVEGTQHQVFRCWDVHGVVDFYKAVSQSCDVYFYELVRRQGLSSSTIGEYARMFGYGEDPGIGLPGTQEGLVPDGEWKLERRNTSWRTGDTLNMVIGQGYLLATPLQVAIATGVVATDGDVIQPTLVKKIVWPEHMKRPPTESERKIRRHIETTYENTLGEVRKGMRLAVTGEKGTAHILAKLPFACAGKTGSAEHDKRRNAHAWFTAYAPYDNPRFVVVALITEGGYGSSTAGPVAMAMLRTAMETTEQSTPQPQN